MSRGEELFDTIQAHKYDHAVGSEEWIYAQTLGTARMVVWSNPDRLYRLLEEAERTGKRIKLVEDLTVLGSPYDVILI